MFINFHSLPPPPPPPHTHLVLMNTREPSHLFFINFHCPHLFSLTSTAPTLIVSLTSTAPHLFSLTSTAPTLIVSLTYTAPTLISINLHSSHSCFWLTSTAPTLVIHSFPQPLHFFFKMSFCLFDMKYILQLHHMIFVTLQHLISVHCAALHDILFAMSDSLSWTRIELHYRM